MRLRYVFAPVLAGLAMAVSANEHGHDNYQAAHTVHAPKPVKVDVPLVNLEEEAKKYSGETVHIASAEHTASPVHSEKKSIHSTHWGYTGATGPAHWGDIDPKFINCKIGRNQSPIDIRDKLAVGTIGLPGLDVVYGIPEFAVINNGHTIQVNYPIGNSYIKVGGHRFELLQFHFHTPSEHQKEGFNYPMEMHLVHKDGDGNLAVIGILYKEGAFNPELQKLIDNLPKDVGQVHRHKEVRLDLRKFFPKDTRFYKYSGSLTTPPCSEGVYWMVFKQPIEASADQIAIMEKLMGANNRPVQGIHSRHVLKSWSEPNMENEFYYY
jgi:carbonic anhydrase